MQIIYSMQIYSKGKFVYKTGNFFLKLFQNIIIKVLKGQWFIVMKLQTL